MGGLEVLIAEDDAVSRRVLQRAVERSGHTCLLAADGREAWEQYLASDVDVIISDWMTPDVDGPSLCRQVRNYQAATYTCFILLTSLDDKAHFLTGMEAGADDYLTKPFDREELQARLMAATTIATATKREMRRCVP